MNNWIFYCKYLLGIAVIMALVSCTELPENTSSGKNQTPEISKSAQNLWNWAKECGIVNDDPNFEETIVWQKLADEAATVNPKIKYVVVFTRDSVLLIAGKGNTITQEGSVADIVGRYAVSHPNGAPGGAAILHTIQGPPYEVGISGIVNVQSSDTYIDFSENSSGQPIYMRFYPLKSITERVEHKLPIDSHNW